MIDGLHVPMIPFVEVFGNVGEALFKHKGPITENTGSTKSIISMSRVTAAPH